ncbi:MAG: hypothetical protein ABI481_00780 [Pyrinomonadaceae bacterium]
MRGTMYFQTFKHGATSEDPQQIDPDHPVLLRGFLGTSFLLLAVALVMLMLLPQPSYSQNKEDFEVSNLIKNVKERFHLNSRDVGSIRPLVNQENRKVLEVYARFSGDQPEYSDRVWQEIVLRRREFESGVGFNLTPRQKSALRAARAAIEEKILGYLVEDFVRFLAAYLELRDWELASVQKVFELENEKKYRVLSRHFSDTLALNMEMEKISQESDDLLRSLLDRDKWRGYLSLVERLTPTA